MSDSENKDNKEPIAVAVVQDEPVDVAVTSNEENHEDPWQYASEEEADAPVDTGRAPDEDAG